MQDEGRADHRDMEREVAADRRVRRRGARHGLSSIRAARLLGGRFPASMRTGAEREVHAAGSIALLGPSRYRSAGIAHSCAFSPARTMLAIVVIMIVQVSPATCFNASLIWAEELCRYILIWQSFLFIGIAYHQGELIAARDLLSGMLTPRYAS